MLTPPPTSTLFPYTTLFRSNLLSSIPEQRIVTASSGNYGQAVAYACKLLGKQCTVVMPSTSAQVKIDAVQSYGGIVRSEEHTSELQSRGHLVCRLLLEKKRH